MSILVLGTVALDTITTPSGRRTNILGGSATHFALSARLFSDVHVVAVVGEDFPARYLNFLRHKRINIDSLTNAPGKTFHWEGKYHQDFDTAITVRTELGVLSSFKPAISYPQRRIKNVFLANVDPDIQRSVLHQMRAPRLVALDSMNYWIRHKRISVLKLLRKVDIYVANEGEARSLSGEDNLVRAAEYLRSQGPKRVVIKKGEHGALFLNDRDIVCLPAYPLAKVVDPTGAGDTFAGGFMGYLASHKVNSFVLKRALAYGTVAASFNVEGFGTDKTASLTKKDLEARLARLKKITSI